ncbi:MAG: phosphopantothenoylcysteine decarboxylase [Elusimicrobia bacterium]|nr:phosphopantothenoylcysteine decarboxylase [Elusimicrobiota bacterium]MDE2237595.1 phosphopantothenoylcysteine decarboxylase [Elusimicrobiota bacterium]MDE2425552.1 phosphopantothenoylcysteine decarboxylase [Elusimicrobiota bacterium]
MAWQGRSVLITAGPTREPMDPIRFLTNASSGRMGLELARAARRAGARVTVVLGPSPLQAGAGIKVLRVVTARQMRSRVLALCPRVDVVIGAAAVSDWRFLRVRARKLKRGSAPLRLTLLPNPDIIKEVARRRPRGRRQLVIGFALETHSRLAHARRKLREKGLDAVVANGPESLSGSRAKAVFLTPSRARPLGCGPKARLAAAIIKEIEALL